MRLRSTSSRRRRSGPALNSSRSFRSSRSIRIPWDWEIQVRWPRFVGGALSIVVICLHVHIVVHIHVAHGAGREDREFDGLGLRIGELERSGADFLAADLLINELGIDADSRSSLTPNDWLPEPSDTIISRVSTSIAVQAERDLLAGWVAEGGHLGFP